MASLIAIDGSKGSTLLVISQTAIRKIERSTLSKFATLRDLQNGCNVASIASTFDSTPSIILLHMLIHCFMNVSVREIEHHFDQYEIHLHITFGMRI